MSSVALRLIVPSLLLLVAGCRACDPNAPRSTGTPDRPWAPESVRPTAGEGPPTAEIVALQTQLTQLGTDPKRWTPENRTAHKTALSDFIRRAELDLNRKGKLDDDTWEALRDSVLHEETGVGGGTGLARGPKPDQIEAHVRRVYALISRYQQLAGAPAPGDSDSAARR